MLLNFRCAGGRTIDPEKFLPSAENQRVDLENFRRDYKLGVVRQHRIYRNLSLTENTVSYSMSVLFSIPVSYSMPVSFSMPVSCVLAAQDDSNNIANGWA